MPTAGLEVDPNWSLAYHLALIVNGSRIYRMANDEPADPSPRASGRRDGNVTIGVLRAFVEAFEHGSFSKAAQSQGVSQPAISNQINALEQTLGVRLMNRRGATLTLTDVGREIFVRARLALAKVGEIEDIAREFQSLRKGRLIVGFSSPALAVPALGRFRQVYPDIEIITRSGNSEQLRQDLLECRIDLALFSLLTPDDHLDCRQLEDLELQLVLRVDDPRFRSGHASLQELLNEPLIFREPGSMTRALTEAALKPLGAWQGPALTVTGNAAVKSAVAAGLGLALMFRGEADEDRRLRTVDVDGRAHSAGFYLVTLPENAQVPSIAAFSSIVKN